MCFAYDYFILLIYKIYNIFFNVIRYYYYYFNISILFQNFDIVKYDINIIHLKCLSENVQVGKNKREV